MDNNDRLYHKLDKIEEKIERKFDSNERRLDGIEKELVVYNEELKHHIEGVKQNKLENTMLREYIDVEVQKLHEDFSPVKDHVAKIENMGSVLVRIWNIMSNILAFVTLVAGTVYGIGRLMGWFK